MNSIEVKGLVKSFNHFTLGPIDLQVPKGYMVGYIGENGAGKSTTIKLLLGLLKPDAGEIMILGEKLTEDNTAVKNRIGVVYEDLYMPGDLKLSQVENFCRKLYQAWNQKKFAQYMKDFSLPWEQQIKNLSRGMKMKLSLGIALSHGAELLILDEGTSGLDPVVRDEILDILLDFLQDESHSVFISSHILSDLEKAADYIAFLHEGKLLFMEFKDKLKDDYALCAVDKEMLDSIDPEAIVGRRTHAFGEELLVKRALMPEGIPLEQASMEDIMVYTIKGGH